MTSRFLVAAVTLLIATTGWPQDDREPLVTVSLGSDDFTVGRPYAWRQGISDGPAVLQHYIGSGDGFPHFTAMADADAALPKDTNSARLQDAVEELFDTLTANDEIHETGWTEINDLRVHSSLATRSSVAGAITRRRLVFTHEGVPYVLVWADYASRYDSIAELVETCVQSLGRPQGSVADAAPAANARALSAE
ncbi:MAG: hypothetical protein GKS06_08360 [Acidobacteria bacterium]|nr:hypothetical protein [Acidobacteriota bacterium]